MHTGSGKSLCRMVRQNLEMEPRSRESKNLLRSMKGSEMKNTFSVGDLTRIAIAAALISLCSWISIPAAVPFTLQTFAVFLVLSLLGGKNGTAAIAVYLLLGAVGVPVFAGFTGGLGILLGNTGGYLLGFLLTGISYWCVTARLGKSKWAEFLALLLGLLLCYALGTLWFSVVYARANGAVGLGTILSWCVLPFILPDLVKLGLALALSRRIAPALKKTGF